jgi:hypothetical protein
MIGVTKFRKGKLKPKHGARVDEKYLWDSLRPIIPYPTGRFFARDVFPGTSCQATIVPSLRDALADISQQHLASRFSNMELDQILNTKTGDKTPAYFLVVLSGTPSFKR